MRKYKLKMMLPGGTRLVELKTTRAMQGYPTMPVIVPTMRQERVMRFCYRKIVDAAFEKPWKKYVFDNTDTEFRMQSHLYNAGERHSTFAELLAAVPAAEKTYCLLSAGAMNYIQQPGGLVPDVLNGLKTFLPFNHFCFRIINSDIRDKSRHQVAVNFYSGPLTWHEAIANPVTRFIARQKRIR
jgi:hypothetical protein